MQAFERFLTSWEELPTKVENRHQRIKRYVKPGLVAGYKYYRRLEARDAYVIAQGWSNIG